MLEGEATKDISLNDQEKWYIIASQMFVPFMVAGLGMVAAGLILERVKVCAYGSEKSIFEYERERERERILLLFLLLTAIK